MNNKFQFNSDLEIAFRYLMTLYITETQMDVDRIVLSDFITIYARAFGVADYNLHGINEYSFAEYAARRAQSYDAVKRLVFDELVSVTDTPYGVLYKINDNGKAVCDNMSTAYAANYMNTAYLVKAYIEDKTSDELISIITKGVLDNRRCR